MPVLQPVYYTIAHFKGTTIAAGATATVMGRADNVNGFRPYRVYTKGLRITTTYTPSASSGTSWTFQILDPNDGTVVSETFVRNAGQNTVVRDINVAFRSTNDSTPSALTAQVVNPAGATLSNFSLLLEGYSVNP